MNYPKVEVISHSNFNTIPEELWDEKSHYIGQDDGEETERLIECAGRTCYDSYGKGRNSREYHQHIKEVGHGSVLEHATISFYIDNISRGLSHELVRHRVGIAISQRSTRYVDESESNWIYHPLIQEHIISRFETLSGVVTLSETLELSNLYEEIHQLEAKAKILYKKINEFLEKKLIEEGIDKQTARKQSYGAARGILGNALCTSMVWTANIRTLRHFIEQRASKFADGEIRLLANRIYEESLKICPSYFNDYEKIDCPDGIGYELITKYKKI